MDETYAEVLRIYTGSNGDDTKALYTRLSALGLAGKVAVDLFRAQKASERAKAYRGRRFRGSAYDKKEWSIGNLCETLGLHAADLRLIWGWGIDEKQSFHRHVIYVDLPTGQVSFHSAYRGAGPDYPGEWDGVPKQGPTRIVRWTAHVLDSRFLKAGRTDEASLSTDDRNGTRIWMREVVDHQRGVADREFQPLPPLEHVVITSSFDEEGFQEAMNAMIADRAANA